MKPISCSCLANWLTSLFLIGTLLGACHRPPVRTEKNETNVLIGAWEKVSPVECSKGYPDMIEFGQDGIYQSQSEATAVVMAWDAGTYEVDRQIVKIANAQEISKSYRFVIKNEIVTFEDDQGCKFPYRRM
ncbi:hypothetical protein GCM10027347_42600 [Larkinella harenae]